MAALTPDSMTLDPFTAAIEAAMRGVHVPRPVRTSRRWARLRRLLRRIG